MNNASIRSTWCSVAGNNGLDWRGRGNGGVPDANNASFGQTGYCLTSYKISDGDANYDYFAVEMAVTFTQKGTDYFGGEATVTVSSNKNTQSNYFSASDTRTSTDCAPVDVGVAYGLLSASIPFRICDSASFARTAMSQTSASYRASNVAKTKKVSFVFMQKVNAGVKPTFSGILRFPYYSWNAPNATHPDWWYTESFGQTSWSIGT